MTIRLLGALALISLAATIAWRSTRAVSAPHAVVVVDRSGSIVSACEGVKAIVSRIADAPSFRGSTVTLLATGTTASTPEPVWVWSGEVPRGGPILEGKSPVREAKQRFVRDAMDQCGELPAATSSPVFLALKRAIEQLRASGCGSDSSCAVYIKTDGAENVERAVAHALNEPSRTITLPAPLPNAGIRIVFCGIAESSPTVRARARGARGHADRTRAVWSAALADPTLATFEPFCRVPAAETAQATR